MILAAALWPAPAAADPAQDAKHRRTVLATGDSMIQIVDSLLKQRLARRRGVRVRSDAHISTGISKPFGLNWGRYARRQARRVRPRATIMFLGANDGFPMRAGGRRSSCCGKAWIGEYSRRAAKMMEFYSRGGDARVYWLLLPQARGGNFRKVFPAVNEALRRARAKKRGEARLVHLNRVFTPGGRYRAVMRWRGRRVKVRQGDGVHLSRAGASIAASIVIRAMGEDRILRRRWKAPRRRKD